jgi:hypothetical protein
MVSNRHYSECYFGGHLYYSSGENSGKIPAIEQKKAAKANITAF